MLCILVGFLILEPAEFRRKTKGLLELTELRLEVDDEREHDDDVQTLTLDSQWRNVTEANDSHGDHDIVQHIVISIYVNVLEVVLIGLVRGVLPIRELLPHGLVERHVLNSEHARREQEDDDDEGKCELERDSDHLALDHCYQPEDREEARHPQQFHVHLLDHCGVRDHFERNQRCWNQTEVREETLHREDVDYSILRDEEVYQVVCREDEDKDYLTEAQPLGLHLGVLRIHIVVVRPDHEGQSQHEGEDSIGNLDKNIDVVLDEVPADVCGQSVSLLVALLHVVILLDLVLHVDEVVHLEERGLLVYNERHFYLKFIYSMFQNTK